MVSLRGSARRAADSRLFQASAPGVYGWPRNSAPVDRTVRPPSGRIEVDLHVTDRTGIFACTCLITEILAPRPHRPRLVADHSPAYELHHERERRLQTAKVVRVLEQLGLLDERSTS